jgi:hypothetical protein
VIQLLYLYHIRIGQCRGMLPNTIGQSCPRLRTWLTDLKHSMVTPLRLLTGGAGGSSQRLRSPSVTCRRRKIKCKQLWTVKITSGSILISRRRRSSAGLPELPRAQRECQRPGKDPEYVFHSADQQCYGNRISSVPFPKVALKN